MKWNRRKALVLSISSASMAWHAPGFSQNFPEKSIRWIVPFPAGGPADTLARLICQKLSVKWNTSIFIDNKPGGQTTIGLLDLMRSKPDGYTLGQPIDSSMTMNPFLFSKQPYDVFQDFTNILRLAELPFMVIARKKLDVSSFEDLVALAKKSPGKLSYGFPTPGGQITGAQMASKLGIELLPVPYKGSADVVKGLLSGEIDFAIDPILPYIGYINQGTMVLLASSGKKRSGAAPHVRSFAELGIPEAQVTVWHGLSAPKGLPEAISQKIQRDVTEILDSKDVREKMLQLGLEPLRSNPTEYRETVVEEQKRYGPVIQKMGLKVN